MFNGLGNFLGNVLHGAGNFVNHNIIHPAVQAEQNVVHGVQHEVQQAPSQLGHFLGQVYNQTPVGQVQHAAQQVVRVMPQVVHSVQPTFNNFNHSAGNALSQIPNIRLQGLEQAYGALHPNAAPSQPITLGGVSHHIPILAQAEKFAAQPQNQQTIGNFAKGISTTGAHYAPYAAPELKILKGGGTAKNIIAKGVNNFVPGATTSVISDVASGNRNAGNITKNALTAGAFNAGGSIALGGKGLKTKVEMPGHITKAAQDLHQSVLPHNEQFGQNLNKLSQQLNTPVIHGPVKTPARIAEKAHNDYGGDISQVKDAVRGTIHLQNPADLQAHIDAIAQHYPVVGVKNTLDATHGGYRDAKVTIQLPSGHLGEIKLGIPEHLHAADNLGGHSLYEQIRDPNVSPADKASLIAHSDALYSAANRVEAKRLNSASDILRPNAMALRGGQGLPKSLNPTKSLPSNPTTTGISSTSKNVGSDSLGMGRGGIDAGISNPSFNPTVAHGLPTVNTDSVITPNKFTSSVQHSPQVSQEVKGMVSGQHEVRNTGNLMQSARDQIAKEGLHPATERILSELATPAGSVSDTTLAHALEAAKAHDALGTEAGHNMAASLYDQISEHGTAKGQGVQILSQIARSSPAGLRNKAFKDLKKAGVPLTEDLKKAIQGHIDGITKMPDGPARDMAIAVLQKEVAKHLPQKLGNNAISIWKAGLLSGAKTQGGNFLSNATFGALHKVSDPLAAALDKGISYKTGLRTKTATVRGYGSGAKEGLGTAKTTLQTGIDPRGVGDKYEQHAEINFSNKILQKVLGNPSNLVFRSMSAADQPFYYGALKNSLYDQAKADGLNAGLKGKALLAHMDKTVQNPTEKMVETATKEAQTSVLGQDNALASWLAKSTGNRAADAAKNVLVPFTKVPTNFIARTLDFTPVGAVKTAIEQAQKGKLDQRALTTAISEATTGSAIIGLGWALANSGQLSGDYPNSPTEQARWKTERIQPNSVKIGGQWISLNYLGPVGLLFGAGKNAHDAAQQGNNAVVAGIGGLGKGLTGQSFLQGLSGAVNAINEPGRYLDNLVKSQVASVVPSWVNDIGNATDGMQRQSNNPIQAIQARIPGLREGLNPKMDAFGNDLTQASGSGISTALNPLKPSNDVHTPLLNELDRLKQAGQSIFPTPDKNLTVGKETIKLNDQQQHDYNQAVGQKTQDLWGQITKDPTYQTLPDDKKKQALSNAYDDIKKVEQIKVLQSMGKASEADQLVKKLGSRAILAGEGKVSPADYTALASGKNLSPQQQYQVNLQKFQQDQAAGKLTSVQVYRQQQSLGKEAITSQYSPEVLQFYGMSKAQQSNFFATDKAKATDLYNQAKQLDAQLLAKGYEASSKYKNGLSTRVTRVSVGGTNKSRTTRTKVRVARIAKPKIAHIAPLHAAKIAKIPTVHAPKVKPVRLAAAPRSGKKFTLTS